MATSSGSSSQKRHEYQSDKITVQYDARRCIHAAECADGLPVVFNPQQRPWVNAAGAAVDEILAVVMQCPTGALHVQRKDGGPAETAPEKNTVAVKPDGPLYVRGEVHIKTPEGNLLLQDTRVALCRCGASQNRPLCDNSHIRAKFRDAGSGAPRHADSTLTASSARQLTVTPSANGSLVLEGWFEIYNAVGDMLFQGERAWLCRCGASQDKPFCDGSHATIGFHD